MGAESEAQVVCMSKRPVCSHHWEGAKLLLVNLNDVGDSDEILSSIVPYEREGIVGGKG